MSTFERALEEMPLFPLPNIVLFPGMKLPLHVFEQRYRTMITDCMNSHRTMAMVMLVDPARQAEETPPIAHIAGAGMIVEYHLLPDGRSNLLLVGKERVSIEELPFTAAYRRAKATVLQSRESLSSSDRASLLSVARAFVTEIRKRDSRFGLAIPDGDDSSLVDACAAALVIDPAVKHAALGDLDVRARAERVTTEVAQQLRSLVDKKDDN